MNWMKPDGTVVHGFLGDNELIRETGLIEQTCEHGVGHPVGHVKKWDPNWMGVHGCDGCCSRDEFDSKGTARITSVIVCKWS